MKTKCRTLPLASIVLLICAMIAGCRRADPGHARTESAAILREVCIMVALKKDRTAEPVPVTLRELVAWLEEFAPSRDGYIDYKNRTITDIWGNQVMVISEGGKFVGVGSPGSDRQWEGGSGDDIIAKLGESGPMLVGWD